MKYTTPCCTKEQVISNGGCSELNAALYGSDVHITVCIDDYRLGKFIEELENEGYCMGHGGDSPAAGTFPIADIYDDSPEVNCRCLGK